MKFNLSDKCCSLIMLHCTFSNFANKMYTKFIANIFNITYLNCTSFHFPHFGGWEEKGEFEMPEMKAGVTRTTRERKAFLVLEETRRSEVHSAPC